ncbi:pilus assembly protein, partial [Acinetobacter pittii]
MFYIAIYILWLGEFKHEVRQFEKSYDNQQAEQISLM